MIKGIEKLKLDVKQRKLLSASEMNCKRSERVFFEVISFENDVLTVKVWQRETEDEKYLTVTDLIERAKSVFRGLLSENTTIHVRPIPFRLDDLEKFSVMDIESGMKEFGLKPKDLGRLLNIDKSTISVILSDERALTKSSTAMFYYLFKFLKNGS
jgi:hypothetical protein